MLLLPNYTIEYLINNNNLIDLITLSIRKDYYIMASSEMVVKMRELYKQVPSRFPFTGGNNNNNKITKYLNLVIKS